MKEPRLSLAKVYRYDPGRDKRGRYVSYSVPIEGKTVLDVLRFIYENHDSSLSFRSGCAGGGYQRCGACAVLVNGRPALACGIPAMEKMTIGPHPKFEVIKDLALDFDRERKARPKAKPAAFIRVDVSRCDGCRDCVLLCPVNVFDLQKTGTRPVSVPADAGSCCGLTCRQCAVFCRNSAIQILPLDSNV